jgi:O-antigen ligase
MDVSVARLVVPRRRMQLLADAFRKLSDKVRGMIHKLAATVLEYSAVAFLLLLIVCGSLIDEASSGFCGINFLRIILDPEIQWVLFACIAIWCAFFATFTFELKDISLVCLLIIAVFMYASSFLTASKTTSAIVLLAGATLGKEVRFLWSRQHQCFFIWGLILMLATASWCHIDLVDAPYHGPRWMGLWNNPNTYGMLMSAGLLLAVGLLVEKQDAEDRRQKWLSVILFIAAAMMIVGLFFSYCRGAWLGAIVGLLYLAKAHGKFKWRFVLMGIFVVAAVVYFFWSSTPDTAPWYLKRMDFGRASAQHRVAAWKAGFEIMRDNPLGVGWNKAVEIYERHYSPPQNGASAIITNDYLMLGTELGVPSLLCFIAYIYLKFKPKAADSLQVACRAGALVLLMAFWFDGGLFELPTAALFWILLELGTSDSVNFTASVLSFNSRRTIV